jgi:pimeloyl-ACP methyl ester carboxylesterase
VSPSRTPSSLSSRVRGHRRPLLIAAVAVTALAVATPIAAASAATSTTSHAAAKPTIVLVHGAWADPSSFGPVVKRLQKDGYTVLNEPNPLRGLSSDAAYLDDFIDHRTTGPVILVGHSYGGAVITNITNEPRVKALVYVDAFAPKKGQSVSSLTASVPGAPPAAAIFDTVPIAGAPANDVDLYFKPSLFPTVFANGLPAAEASELATSESPVTSAALAEGSGTPSFASRPSWYVLGTQDNVIAPSLQLQMATAAHSHIVRVSSGHLSMLTHPGLVTNVIKHAACVAR